MLDEWQLSLSKVWREWMRKQLHGVWKGNPEERPRIVCDRMGQSSFSGRQRREMLNFIIQESVIFCHYMTVKLKYEGYACPWFFCEYPLKPQHVVPSLELQLLLYQAKLDYLKVFATFCSLCLRSSEMYVYIRMHIMYACSIASVVSDSLWPLGL